MSDDEILALRQTIREASGALDEADSINRFEITKNTRLGTALSYRTSVGTQECPEITNLQFVFPNTAVPVPQIRQIFPGEGITKYVVDKVHRQFLLDT